MKVVRSAISFQKYYNICDFNGNGGCSLAEIDKMVVEQGFAFSKPTLMRAYKKTTLQDGDKDAWVERKEFRALLRNLVLFEKLWDVFDGLDEDDDRRIDVGEFRAGLGRLGCDLSEAAAPCPLILRIVSQSHTVHA